MLKLEQDKPCLLTQALLVKREMINYTVYFLARFFLTQHKKTMFSVLKMEKDKPCLLTEAIVRKKEENYENKLPRFLKEKK